MKDHLTDEELIAHQRIRLWRVTAETDLNSDFTSVEARGKTCLGAELIVHYPACVAGKIVSVHIFLPIIEVVGLSDDELYARLLTRHHEIMANLKRKELV